MASIACAAGTGKRARTKERAGREGTGGAQGTERGKMSEFRQFLGVSKEEK